MKWIKLQIIKFLSKLFYFVDDIDNLYIQYKNYQEFKNNASRAFLTKSIVLESEAQKIHDQGFNEGRNYVVTKVNKALENNDPSIVLNMNYDNKEELKNIALVLMTGLARKKEA